MEESPEVSGEAEESVEDISDSDDDAVPCALDLFGGEHGPLARALVWCAVADA